jgi:acyl-homoserine-lactone acylase
MVPTTVVVAVLQPDGRLEQQRHTYWETRFGPMIESPDFPWTDTIGYALRDDLMLNFRWMNQDLETNRARSVQEIEQAGRKYMAMYWLNTHATDSAGNVYYADRSPVPHITDAQAAVCGDDGKPFMLDGSRSGCLWGTDPDSVVPGAFGPAKLPSLMRRDYVHDANNGHWPTNPHQPLEGYPRIVGPERTELTPMRARAGLLKVERRLNGTDGYPGKRFTLEQWRAITWDNHVLVAGLWRKDVVDLCRTLPAASVGEACEVLARWDETDNLDSPGALLWRRFDENLEPKPWKVAFDPNDPVDTPRGIDTSNPAVAAALVRAVADLRGSGMPLDGTWRRYQSIQRGGRAFPVTGGDVGGQYNVASAAWVPGEGYPDVNGGSFYMAWVRFTDTGPVASSVLWYGQSNDSTSPHFVDQLRLFSEKQSKPLPFSERDIAADPALVVTTVRAGVP